jgi:hypothetical protein
MFIGQCHGKQISNRNFLKRGVNMKNMGQMDRIIRFIAGAGLFSLLFVLNSNWKYIGILGIVLLFTSVVGICPLYMPFKIDTRKKKLGHVSSNSK